MRVAGASDLARNVDQIFNDKVRAAEGPLRRPGDAASRAGYEGAENVLLSWPVIAITVRGSRPASSKVLGRTTAPINPV